MQCKALNVLSVYFFFNTLSCQNYFFPGVWGVYKIIVEIPKGLGGYFSSQKLEIPGRKGAYVKFPPWWGMDIFWNYTIHVKTPINVYIILYRTLIAFYFRLLTVIAFSKSKPLSTYLLMCV